MIPSFNDLSLRNLSAIVADLLTHRQIGELLANLGFEDFAVGGNKNDRLFYSWKRRQVADKCGNNVLSFVLSVFNPRRFNDEAEYEKERGRINEKLLYDGIEIDAKGTFRSVTKATTISEAKARSQKIKNRIHGIAIHGDILPYCEEQWLQENYFHAILEITKSVAAKLRTISGFTSDGSDLIDECFGMGKGKKPKMAFNTLSTLSEESEHKGFGNFCKGFFSMYRNPKAHGPKILEDTELSDMTEVLVIASIIHRKLDVTVKTGY